MAAVGQLAAGVAHEINNPVAFVSANLSALATNLGELLQLLDAYQGAQADLPLPQREALLALAKRIDMAYLREDVPALLDESRDGLKRVKRIVADLLDFSSPLSLDLATADLNALLNHAADELRHELSGRATLRRELAALPPISCNAAQLTRVFGNLLLNASQALTSPGTITLRSGVGDDATLWVEIADTGAGMTPEVKSRAFDPFFTTRAVGAGTGLGLTLAWEIVKRHHGSIRLDSEPGQGTRVRCCFPIDPSATAAVGQTVS